jgi:hypothetical protein
MRFTYPLYSFRILRRLYKTRRNRPAGPAGRFQKAISFRYKTLSPHKKPRRAGLFYTRNMRLGIFLAIYGVIKKVFHLKKFDLSRGQGLCPALGFWIRRRKISRKGVKGRIFFPVFASFPPSSFSPLRFFIA